MELALRESLNSIFARHEDAGRAAFDVAILEDKIARRLAMFRERRDATFRPLMEAVDSYLLARGYDHEITITDDDPSAPPRERESSFCFHVVKLPRRQDARACPGLLVVCDPFSNTVRFRASRVWPGAGAGFTPSGAMTIEEADLAAFREQMLGFLAALFR